MKNIFITTVLLLTCFVNQLQAQAPNKINYQGVARDGSGNLIVSHALSLRLTILDGAMPVPVYTETHSVTTNAYGGYSVAIGGGTVVSGDMATINWAVGPKALKVEVDPTGGSTYTLVSTSDLVSVPYALFAASAPATHVSSFQPVGCQALASVTTTPAKVGDLGTFTKVEGGTFVEINLQTDLWVQTFGSANGVVFELRVDDVASTNGYASLLVRYANTITPVSLTGIFSGLSAGSHTINLYAAGTGGTASTAMYDPGCFNADATNNVLVKEYH